MKLSPYLMSLLALTTAACDVAFESDPDAADAADGVDGVEWSMQTSALGADPESGMMVAGEVTYSPGDAELDRLAQVVVLGGHGTSAGIRVVYGPNGAVLAAPSDKIITEPAVVDAPISVAVDHHVASGRWLVAAGRPVVMEGPDVEVAWATRAPSSDKHGPIAGNTFVARLPVALTRLPDEARAMLDQTVRIFDTEHEVCIARVTGLTLEARLVHQPLGPWDPAYSDAEIFARGLRTLVAEVSPLAGASAECGAGVVAVGVEASSPELFQEGSVSRRLHDQAIDALCALPAWRAREAGDHTVGWSQCRDLGRRAEVRAFESRAGERFVLVGDGGLYAGFSVDLKRVLPVWSYELPYRPEGMIDVHGDGSPELVMPELERAPRSFVGLTFGGDAREPDYSADWTPIPPTRTAVGGYAVPDFSVFPARMK